MDVSPVLVPITFLIVVAIVVSLLTRYRLLRRILDSGLLNEATVDKLLKPVGARREALKWTLLLFFGGIGLVLIEFIPYQAKTSPLPYGLEAICLSVGFGLYTWLIGRSDAD